MEANGSQVPTDAALVARALGGDAAAADVLVERHHARVWRVAYAIVGDAGRADDAVQNALERAFRALDRFDVSRPLLPWLSTITAREALKLTRHAGRDAELTELVPDAGDAFHDMRERDALVRAVAALPVERRHVVALRYWADMDPSEIAAHLDIPVGTVTSRLTRALAQLRTTLQEVER